METEVDMGLTSHRTPAYRDSSKALFIVLLCLIIQFFYTINNTMHDGAVGQRFQVHLMKLDYEET
jgi:hypothetical protein